MERIPLRVDVVTARRARAGMMVGLVTLLVACGGRGPTRATPTSITGASTTTRGTQPPTSATPATTAPAMPTTSPPTTVPWPGAAQLVTRGDPKRRAVALTFDAGSDVGYAEVILDTLRKTGIHATYALTGAWVRANPVVARRIATEGHVVMNHSDSHRSFTGRSTGSPPLTAAQRRAELDRADAAILAATGASPKPWFRPPYGDTDASVQRDIATAGYRYEVLWTVDSLGWKGASVDAIVDRCLAAAQPGTIFLFHVGAASRDAAALPTVVAGLRSRGYAIVTVTQLVTGG